MKRSEEYRLLKELLDYLVDGNCELKGVEVLEEVLVRLLEEIE